MAIIKKTGKSKGTSKLLQKHIDKSHAVKAKNTDLEFAPKDPIVVSVPSETPEPEARPQRDARGYFLPGNTMTKGTRNRYKRIVETICETQFAASIKELMNKAEKGDLEAIKIALKLTIPAGVEPEAIPRRLKTKTVGELAESMDIVIEEMNEGLISPEGANNYLKCLSAKREFIQVAFLEGRLNDMDSRIKSVEKK